MHERNGRRSIRDGRSPQVTTLLFVCVLAILAFLTAIGRPSWFQLRPATGTAVAMANAGDHPTP